MKKELKKVSIVVKLLGRSPGTRKILRIRCLLILLDACKAGIV